MAETVTTTIDADALRTVRESVEAGEYGSTSEALSDAVRVWQRARAEHAERIAAIKARVREALDDPRPSLSSEEMSASLEAMFAQARKDAKRA